MTSTTKEFSTERMRYLLYETNEVFTQKTWDSSDQDDSVTEPIPRKVQSIEKHNPFGRKSQKIPRMGYRLLQLGILRGSACEGRRRKRNGYLPELWKTALSRDTL